MKNLVQDCVESRCKQVDLRPRDLPLPVAELFGGNRFCIFGVETSTAFAVQTAAMCEKHLEAVVCRHGLPRRLCAFIRRLFEVAWLVKALVVDGNRVVRVAVVIGRV